MLIKGDFGGSKNWQAGAIVQRWWMMIQRKIRQLNGWDNGDGDGDDSVGDGDSSGGDDKNCYN